MLRRRLLNLMSAHADPWGSRAPGLPTASSPTSGILRSTMPRSGCENNTDVGYSMLFAQDHAQEAIVNSQRAAARVIDKAQRPKLVHEVTDPRSRRAEHLRQVFLIDSGMDRFGSAFLAKMRQQ